MLNASYSFHSSYLFVVPLQTRSGFLYFFLNLLILARFGVQTFELSIQIDKHHAAFFVEIRCCCKMHALFSSSCCIIQLGIVAYNVFRDNLKFASYSFHPSKVEWNEQLSRNERNAPFARRILGYQCSNSHCEKVFHNVFAYIQHRTHATKRGTLCESVTMREQITGLRRSDTSTAALSARPITGRTRISCINVLLSNRPPPWKSTLWKFRTPEKFRSYDKNLINLAEFSFI